MTKTTTTIFAAALLACASSAFAQTEQSASYIVQFKSGVPAPALDTSDPRLMKRSGLSTVKPTVVAKIQGVEKQMGFVAKHGFSTAFSGFSANLTPSQAASLAKDPRIARVERDVRIVKVAQSLPYGISNSGATTAPAIKAGDQLANNVSFANVRAVVIDTGVAPVADINLVGYTNYVGDGINGDCDGHGTHVAGTIGAKDDTNGVVGMAPGVPVVAAKVLGCDGSGMASYLIKAIDDTAAQARANPSLRYVINASLGFPTGSALLSLDTAIQNAVASNVLVAVAAGNSADNTCGTTMVKLSSATSSTGVMAVGAVDSAYREASFSSYGSCLAIWAPGVGVLSNDTAGGTVAYSGTSMATPHVAGAAAALRATKPELSATQVDGWLKSNAKPQTTASKDGRQIVHLNVATLGSSTVAPTPAPESIAQATVSGVDFRTVRVNRSASVSVTFRNNGNTAMTLTGFSGLPSYVRVSSNSCRSIAPTRSCSMTLTLNSSQPVTFSVMATTVGATKNATLNVKGTVTP